MLSLRTIAAIGVFANLVICGDQRFLGTMIVSNSSTPTISEKDRPKIKVVLRGFGRRRRKLDDAPNAEIIDDPYIFANDRAGLER